MKRVSLDERLRVLDPRPMTNKIPLMGMTLQGFVNLLKDQGLDYRQEAYRLLRCTDADVDVHATLAEVAYKAAMSNQVWALGILLGSAVSVFGKRYIHGAFQQRVRHRRRSAEDLFRAAGSAAAGRVLLRRERIRL